MGTMEASQFSKERGDRLITKSVIIVKLHASFDEFASETASALRRFLVYRSDGGFSARRLMRESKQLREIHQSYYKMPDGTPIRDSQGLQGQPIRLAVQIFLKKDTNDCWGTTVYFESYVIKPEGHTIEVDNTPPIQKIIGCANMYAKGIKGIEGARIREMMKIFERVFQKSGELDALDLWYYTPRSTIEYSSFRTFDPYRMKMTTGTGGALPFDGFTNLANEEWKIKPFRTMVYDFFRFQGGNCNKEVEARLRNMDREIYQTFVAINEQRGLAGPLIDEMSKIPGGRNKVFGLLAEKFYMHLKKLQNDPKHLYYAFGPNGPQT